MNSITDDPLEPTNQLLLPEKSSAADQLDTPSESQAPQTDCAFHDGTNLKNMPGYYHYGLND